MVLRRSGLWRPSLFSSEEGWMALQGPWGPPERIRKTKYIHETRSLTAQLQWTKEVLFICNFNEANYRIRTTCGKLRLCF